MADAAELGQERNTFNEAGTYEYFCSPQTAGRCHAAASFSPPLARLTADIAQLDARLVEIV